MMDTMNTFLMMIIVKTWWDPNLTGSKNIKCLGICSCIYSFVVGSICGVRVCIKSYLVLFLRTVFTTVGFKMGPQIACLGGCIVALVALVWLFSTVCFQMCPQMPRLKGCIVALITFVSFFSTVSYQMCPQMVRIRRYIVALVAFV